MRGQLIDAPGYMANYAIGSIIIADIRARVKEQHGDFTTGDRTWYAFMTDRIYKFGLSRSSADVIIDFLGRPISANAILADMRRMAAR
jgi:Zn-dependent M32 family carboxypeptidase